MCCLLHSCSPFLREGGSSGVAGASAEARRDGAQIFGDLQLVENLFPHAWCILPPLLNLDLLLTPHL
ncbi:hypothetical protein CHARACLAT_019950 [Characodon lateralis]|uniref:Uncharacterized protein n=1 Tax=Characodon lateralis TaxID=208331 RepID=A0ABU7ECK7_9TELE|nr:hypothetical protein [Characodon lateralis]